MRITLMTVGSRGDVQPYLALALGLQAAGHEVTLATGTDFEDFVTSRNVGYAPLGVDFTSMLGSQEWIDFHEANLLRKVKILKTQYGPHIERVLIDSWRAAQGAEAIVYDQTVLSGPHIAERLGIPAVIGALTPSILATKEFPHPIYAFLRLGGFVNRLTFHNQTAMYALFPQQVNRWRQEVLELPLRPPRESDLVLRGKPIPILHAFSSQVIRKPDDWDDHGHVTGYWFLDSESGWRPSPSLLEFLDRGPAPVYVGFGSVKSIDPASTTRMVITALRDNGLRGILATAGGGLTKLEVPDSIFVLDGAPHDWLFERTSAVVHHGGAGTVGAGLRAGKPTLVCPVDLDQPFWGGIVSQLGAGPRPIPQKKLSLSKLTPALHRVATDGRIQRRARAIGAHIRQERGVANAVHLVEQFCGTSAL